MKIQRDEIAPGVMLYTNALEGDRIISMVEKLATNTSSNSTWEHSSTGNRADISEYRSSLSFSLSPLLDPSSLYDEKQKIYDLTMKPLSLMSRDYTCRYLVDVGFMEPPSILKYVAGANYRTHSDAGPLIHRVVSVVGCLENTSSGGDLEFPILDLSIKIEKNSVLIFPSNFIYKHYAHPVIDGVKYSIVTWWKI